jgi:hypothetical protein
MRVQLHATDGLLYIDVLSAARQQVNWINICDKQNADKHVSRMAC